MCYAPGKHAQMSIYKGCQALPVAQGPLADNLPDFHCWVCPRGGWGGNSSCEESSNSHKLPALLLEFCYVLLLVTPAGSSAHDRLQSGTPSAFVAKPSGFCAVVSSAAMVYSLELLVQQLACCHACLEFLLGPRPVAVTHSEIWKYCQSTSRVQAQVITCSE